MPSSAQIEKGEDIIKQFESLPGFTEDTKAIFKNVMSEMYEKVAENLLEAEKNILELNMELRLFKTEEANFKEDYFPAFNEAKRYLRESRQKVRKLADRTVKEVVSLKVLLTALDESEDTVLLKVSLDKMKALMIETLKTLKGAHEKYNSAQQTIQNLNSSINEKNMFLENMVTNNTTEYENWTTDLRGAINGTIGETPTACKIADYFGALQICSDISDAISGIFASDAISGLFAGMTEPERKEAFAKEAAAKEAALIEDKIDEYTGMLTKFKTITEDMMKSGEDFDKTIEGAIGKLTDEIEKIGSWTNNAEFVNIDKDPKEYLAKYISISNTFANGLNDLKYSAEEFLAEPLAIL